LLVAIVGVIVTSDSLGRENASGNLCVGAASVLTPLITSASGATGQDVLDPILPNMIFPILNIFVRFSYNYA
jgi:hypothetical protein